MTNHRVIHLKEQIALAGTLRSALKTLVVELSVIEETCSLWQQDGFCGDCWARHVLPAIKAYNRALAELGPIDV